MQTDHAPQTSIHPLLSWHTQVENKIIFTAENPTSPVIKQVNVWQHLPRPWVLTNGVFDLLHKGHTHYLMQAKNAGASLIIGVNSDASVRMLGKGEDRPICGLMDRMWMLACLGFVDAVVSFAEKTPIALIDVLRPDIYVKGGDYCVDSLPETPIVKAYGGEVRILDFMNHYSSTNLIQKIRGV